jgi:hypothetical protein
VLVARAASACARARAGHNGVLVPLNSALALSALCLLSLVPLVACSEDEGGGSRLLPSKLPDAAQEVEGEDDFSFFMISYEAIQRYSGSADGFGGNLGGIEGADALCQQTAEYSTPSAKNKVWRAFLSTTQEDAIDRIGKGPWYDRVGRLFANNLAELRNDRPPNAHPEIIDDFPNEYGIPNQYPDSDARAVDNHQTLTGTGANGRLYTQDTQSGGAGSSPTQCPGGWTPEKATCWDWTSSEPEGCPRVGHSWPSPFSGANWISVWNEGGCAPGTHLIQTGGLTGAATVGSGGGYGGFYCFALVE